MRITATAASALLLAACSPAGEDESSGVETNLSVNIGKPANPVPDKLYIECKYPSKSPGGNDMTAIVDFLTVDGGLYNYDSFDNETSYNCSPPRDGCRDRIEGDMIISEREPLFGRHSSIVRVNIDTLEATRVEIIDGEEVPAEGGITCEKPGYPEGVTKGFGM